MSITIKDGDGKMEHRFWTAAGMLVYALMWPWLKWEQWRMQREARKWWPSAERAARRPGGEGDSDG
jgi:hypothetical protein